MESPNENNRLLGIVSLIVVGVKGVDVCQVVTEVSRLQESHSPHNRKTSFTNTMDSTIKICTNWMLAVILGHGGDVQKLLSFSCSWKIGPAIIDDPRLCTKANTGQGS